MPDPEWLQHDAERLAERQSKADEFRSAGAKKAAEQVQREANNIHAGIQERLGKTDEDG